jgi:hypothetical protein
MTSFVTWRVGTTPYPDADLYFTKRANSWKSQNSLALWFSCDGFCYNFANIATHVWRLSSNGMPERNNRAADPVHLRAITRLQPMRRRAPKFIQD